MANFVTVHLHLLHIGEWKLNIWQNWGNLKSGKFSMVQLYISTSSGKPFRSPSWEVYRGLRLRKVALPNRRGWQWKVCCPIEEARGTSCLQVEALMSAQYIAHQVVLLFFGPLLCLCLATIYYTFTNPFESTRNTNSSPGQYSKAR